MKLFIINGPNLDMLGIREPRIYGKESYTDLENYLRQSAKELGLEIEIFQSNHEGALIDEVHRAYFEKADGIIINAGGYTHTSVALLDALKAVAIPTVEVHISDVSRREDFRRRSYVRPACVATVGPNSAAGAGDTGRLPLQAAGPAHGADAVHGGQHVLAPGDAVDPALSCGQSGAQEHPVPAAFGRRRGCCARRPARVYGHGHGRRSPFSRMSMASRYPAKPLPITVATQAGRT